MGVPHQHNKIPVGGELTDFQKKQISEVMSVPSTPEDELKFIEGLKHAEKLFEAESRLDSLTDEKERSACEEEIRRLNNKITSPAKRAGIVSYRPVVAECRRYFEAHGKPENIQDLIEVLRQKGLLRRTYDAGGTSSRNDRTIRDFLQRQFGIEGKPGRKPGKPPTSKP